MTVCSSRRQPQTHKTLLLYWARALTTTSINSTSERSGRVVRDNVGGFNAVVAQNWVPQADVAAFKPSSNDPALSDDDARHARHTGPPPAKVLSVAQGRELLRQLCRGVAQDRLGALKSDGVISVLADEPRGGRQIRTQCLTSGLTSALQLFARVGAAVR